MRSQVICLHPGEEQLGKLEEEEEEEEAELATERAME